MPGERKATLWTRSFVLIIVINFLVFMNHIMVLTTFPIFLQDVLGQDESVAGIAALLFSIIAILLRPFVGWLLNNGRRKSVLMIGLTGMFLMPLGYMLSTALAGLGYSVLMAVALALVCRMLHGVSLAFSNTATATIASDSLTREHFAEGMGYFGMATALATSMAPALGLALKRISFALMFGVSSGFMLLSFVLFLVIRTKRPQLAAKQPLRLRGLIDADAVPASVICVAFLLTWGSIENFLSKYAADNGLPSGGIFFLITAVMLVVVRLTVGKVADRRGEGIFVYSCNAAMLIALVLLAVAPNRVCFLLSAVLAGYAFGGIEPALQSMAVHIAPPERRGSANSTFLCAYDLGMGCGAGIAGALIARLGYQSMFLLIALATVLSVLLYVFWGRRHPSSFVWQKKHAQDAQHGKGKHREQP